MKTIDELREEIIQALEEETTPPLSTIHQLIKDLVEPSLTADIGKNLFTVTSMWPEEKDVVFYKGNKFK